MLRGYATEPNASVANRTGGVQDWSIGELYPCTVQVVGNPHEVGGVWYQGVDLHDDSVEFPRRATYAAAENDVRRHLIFIRRFGRSMTALIVSIAERRERLYGQR